MFRKYPVRRSQLITPFGVGSMTVVKGGVSLLAAGLDNWFRREDLTDHLLDDKEFRVEEHRLQEILRVNHFRLPPDFREKITGAATPNYNLNVPFLRFPQQHFCSFCNTLKLVPLTQKTVPVCDSCRTAKGKNMPLSQMPFVALCGRGHLQDFAWREWVHKSLTPECDGAIQYLTSGGAALAAQKVKCKKCGKERSLANITVADYLSRNLAPNGEYLCTGQKPWLGANESEDCGEPLRGNLRGAANVWYAKVFSSIYIPPKSENCPTRLLEFLQRPEIAAQIQMLRQSGALLTPQLLRSFHALPLAEFADGQIKTALQFDSSKTNKITNQATLNEDADTAFRRTEYEVLRENQTEDLLKTRSVPLKNYDARLGKFFSRIVLVETLQETRAFAGFTRIFAENEQKISELKRMLRRREPQSDEENWLPAATVFGEGIFLELDEENLRRWETEKSAELAVHLGHLINSYRKMCRERGWKMRNLSPRFFLLHTLAHLLINRLTFECGYSTASLRERIYVSDKPDAPMAGILIYTAAGDAEGTLGGLVRMGHAGRLENVLLHALEHARWCSSDPVCNEMGEHGQGPDSCNLAACHSCALIPETSCEEFNRFLDRTIVVNAATSNQNVGYFDFN